MGRGMDSRDLLEEEFEMEIVSSWGSWFSSCFDIVGFAGKDSRAQFSQRRAECVDQRSVGRL